MIDIRTLGTADAAAYCDLRLLALETEPFAFGSSAEEHRAVGVEEIAARHLADVPEGNFMLGAFDAGSLIGIVGLFRSERPKTRHRADVVAMFVRPEARGRGAARALLAALVRRARGYSGLEQVELSVATGATAARALYRSAGFVPGGVQPRALKVGDAYADLETMTLDLRSGG